MGEAGGGEDEGGEGGGGVDREDRGRDPVEDGVGEAFVGALGDEEDLDDAGYGGGVYGGRGLGEGEEGEEGPEEEEEEEGGHGEGWWGSKSGGLELASGKGFGDGWLSTIWWWC